MSVSAYDVLAYAGSRAVDVVALVLAQTIMLLGYAFANYPNASTLALAVVFVYVIYKTLRRMVRFWLGIFLFVVKFTFYLLVAFTLLAVYVRGFKRFFTKDIFYLKELLNTNTEGSEEYLKDYAYKLASDERFGFLNSAKEFIEGSTFEFDESYLNQDNIREGLENLQHLFNNYNFGQ